MNSPDIRPAADRPAPETPLPALPALPDPELAELASLLRAQAQTGMAPTAVEVREWAERLEGAAARLAADGDALKRRLLTTLSLNHDINNALVGVVGNTQLLGLGPAAALPGVKERLEVIAREANRIKSAAQKLSELKHTLLVEGGLGRNGGQE
jgi:signal transduction histidine kinase